MKTPKWQLEDVYNTDAQLPCDFWAEYEFVPHGESMDVHTITDVVCHVTSTATLPWYIKLAIRDWWEEEGPEFVQKWVRQEHESREE